MTTVYGGRLPACMGGWCAVRDHCGRFHQVADRAMPAERLCDAGEQTMFLHLVRRVDRHLILVPAIPPAPRLPHAA